MLLSTFVKNINNPQERSLEEYLRALLPLLQHLETLSRESFLACLQEAMCAEPLAFDDAWRSRHAAGSAEAEGVTWEDTLLAQIVDLREMAEAGLLANKFRSFGIPSPRGEYWYNVEPESYLECAAFGALANGVQEDKLSWQDVALFLWCGQNYE